jgi:hypothetical protein
MIPELLPSNSIVSFVLGFVGVFWKYDYDGKG